MLEMAVVRYLQGDVVTLLFSEVSVLYTLQPKFIEEQTISGRVGLV